MARTQGFRKRERVQHRRDFARAYAASRRAGNDVLVVYVVDNGLSWTRLGISVSRRVGPAVRRSYVRRRIREAFRTQKERFPVGLDIVCVARPKAGDKAVDLRSALVDLVRRAAARPR